MKGEDSKKSQRDPEIPSNGLSHPQSIERSRERINDAVCNGSIILVTVIVRRNEIEAGMKDGAQKKVDPLGGDGPQI